MQKAAVFALFAVVSPLTQSARAADFAREIQPVFAKRCVGCHGPGQQMAGLRLDDPAAAIAKGIIVAGKAGTSPLVERISSDKKGFQMPPMGERLAPAEVATIRSWIDEGAKLDGVTAAAPSKPFGS